MKICTIGFTQKNAETFFGLLKGSGVKTLIDVRLNNTSQLAAFAKGEDLKFFLSEIGGICYRHDVLLAPTEDLLRRYKKGETSWEEYEREFLCIMEERGIREHIAATYGDCDAPVCLLCSEATPEHCHRRLVADLFAAVFPDRGGGRCPQWCGEMLRTPFRRLRSYFAAQHDAAPLSWLPLEGELSRCPCATEGVFLRPFAGILRGRCPLSMSGGAHPERSEGSH